MANVLYPKFKQSLLTQSPSINLSSDTIKAALVNLTTDYTYSSAHQYKSSVTSYAGTTDQTLTNKTTTDGVFDADDIDFGSVSIDGSKTIGGMVIYKDTGVAATSPLIAFIDTGGSFPATPTGGSLEIIWDSGANKIFTL
jgi:hypothetical protein